MKDGISERMYLVTTIFALEAFTSFDAVVAGISDTTLGAGWHIAVSLLEHVNKARIIVGKLPIELVNRMPHYLPVYYRGYMLPRDSRRYHAYIVTAEGSD